MRRIRGIVAAAMLLMAGGPLGRAQAAGATAGASTVAAPGGPSSGDSVMGHHDAGQPAAPASPSRDNRTEKQKALAMQTERLFDMATELKAQVDKTNKNILSLMVVE